MRVVSLLPAATEIVCALGMSEALVAVSHDCDHPPAVRGKPPITRCEIEGADLSSADVDRWVRETLAERGTLYTIDEPLLRDLRPDVILTQRLCDVCAPSYGSVAHLAATLDAPPEVVNLEPSSLADILTNVRTVADVLAVPERGEALVRALEERVHAVRDHNTRRERRPRCVVLEWLDPPYCSGHWGPELVELAGGIDPLGRKGQDSRRPGWEAIVNAAPEVLVLACCGRQVQRTLDELPALTGQKGWPDLPAVRTGNVFVMDGASYLSRPGPRIVDSLELLAGVLHPDRFPEHAPDAQPHDTIARVGAPTPAARVQP